MSPELQHTVRAAWAAMRSAENPMPAAVALDMVQDYAGDRDAARAALLAGAWPKELFAEFSDTKMFGMPVHVFFAETDARRRDRYLQSVRLLSTSSDAPAELTRTARELLRVVDVVRECLFQLESA